MLLSREQVIAAIPKLFALIGDAVASKTGWYVEIRAVGLGSDEKPQYFMSVSHMAADILSIDMIQ